MNRTKSPSGRLAGILAAMGFVVVGALVGPPRGMEAAEWSATRTAADNGAGDGAQAAPEPAAVVPERFAVEQTFDGTGFSCRAERRRHGNGWTVYRLTFPSPVRTPVEANNTIVADYFVPVARGPASVARPAVVCLHILNGNFELEEMVCAMLASRGIAAILPKLPYYGERAGAEGRRLLQQRPELLPEALRQGLLDVRRTIDVLQSRPEVDRRCVGVVGISMGGILGATVAGEDARVARAALILAGGDLETIIGHARETCGLRAALAQLPEAPRAEALETLRRLDPLMAAPKLRDRAAAGRVLMINAQRDEVIPPECTEKLAAALGIADRVVWLEGLGHYTALAALPRALKQTCDFFAADLPEPLRSEPPAPAAASPVATLAALAAQLGAVIDRPPTADRCHVIELAFTIRQPGQQAIEGELRLARGHAGRFRLAVKADSWGEAALGQDTAPWLAARGSGTVFRGVFEPGGSPRDPLGLIDPQQTAKLKAAAGALTAIALVPDALGRWIDVEADAAADGPRLRVARKGHPDDRAELRLDAEGRTPRRLMFDVSGISGEIEFRAWQLDGFAAPALFDPPADATVREVPADDLYRMWTAWTHFALESIR